MATARQKKLGTAVAIGAGVAALSAAGYLLFGPGGEERREKLRGFALRMKGEVLERLEEFQEITQPIFSKIVSEVAASYIAAGSATREEVEKVAEELRRNWEGYARMSKRRSSRPRSRTRSRRKANK